MKLNSTAFCIQKEGQGADSKRFWVCGNIASKSPDAIVTSSYVYDNQKVAPLAIEKNYGEFGGRIIIVNSVGYFDAIFRSPEHFFPTLANFPNLIDMTASKYREAMPIVDTGISGARFYGDLSLSGDSAINGQWLDTTSPDPQVSIQMKFRVFEYSEWLGHC